MHESFVEVLDEAADGGSGRYLATAATTGPWSPDAQHGGPPSALLVRAAERCARLGLGRDDLVARRFAAEFLAPVPLGELRVDAEALRAGRSAVLVAARLTTDGADGPRTCLQAHVWLVGRSDTPASPGAPRTPSGLPSSALGFPYAEHVEWLVTAGVAFGRGPAAVWARPRVPLVAGETLSGLQRAVLVGDSASGIAADLLLVAVVLPERRPRPAPGARRRR